MVSPKKTSLISTDTCLKSHHSSCIGRKRTQHTTGYRFIVALDVNRGRCGQHHVQWW